MKRLRILLIAVLGLAVVSCCNCRKSQWRAASLAGTTWQLIRMEGRTFTAGGERFTLAFSSEGRVSGLGDCNRLTGSYSADPARGALTLAGMASTRMLCPNQGEEDTFLGLLSGIDNYRIDGRMLLLLKGSEVQLMFERRE